MPLPTPPPVPAERYRVRLGSAGDLAAAVPHLLGFHPQESVVLVALGGASGRRVGLTARADLPATGDAPALAAGLARAAQRDGAAAAALVVVSETRGGTGPDGGPPGLPHRGLLHELVLALAAVDVPVREALLVARGRWWSYDCPHPCCAPGAGTPLPREPTELAAASVAAGCVVAAGRDELARRLDPPGEAARAAMGAACLDAGSRRAAAVRERGRDAVAAADLAAVHAAVGHLRGRAPARLGDREVAELGWALRDVAVRDRALALALDPDPAGPEQLWTECARRLPSPLDAAPATLLAVSAWLRGDGAMADVALRRARASDPGHALARLLEQALAACLPPQQLRELVARACGDACGSGW